MAEAPGLSPAGELLAGQARWDMAAYSEGRTAQENGLSDDQPDPQDGVLVRRRAHEAPPVADGLDGWLDHEEDLELKWLSQGEEERAHIASLYKEYPYLRRRIRKWNLGLQQFGLRRVAMP